MNAAVNATDQTPVKYTTTRTENDALVVTIVVPELRDQEIVHALRDEVLSEMASSGTHHVIVDLRNVHFMASVGFQAFLSIKRHLHSGSVIICEMSAPIRRTFEICRLIPTEGAATAPFAAAGTLEEALAGLK
ncbi:MAG: STAS domain-containing protein [Planctomycetota bacterium]|nr:STAS domain-containing protein [Planctomycetota bacterium]